MADEAVDIAAAVLDRKDLRDEIIAAERRNGLIRQLIIGVLCTCLHTTRAMANSTNDEGLIFSSLVSRLRRSR